MSQKNASILVSGKTTPRRFELMLDSLAGQTERDLEILFAADSLDPECAHLISAYGDSRMRVLPNFSACRRQAIGWSMAVVNAGDIWHPQMLARTGAMLGAIRDAQGVQAAAVLLKAGRREPLPPGPPPVSSWLMRADALPRELDPRQAGKLAEHLYGAPIVRGEPLVWVRDPAPDRPSPRDARDLHLFGETFERVDLDLDRPPTLFVLVNAEAEFDWSAPFTRETHTVGSIARLRDAFGVFETYGVRPLLMVDLPVASTDESLDELRPLVARGAAVIGAHLHPWTTPPFVEPLDDHNSFPGNLSRDVEAAKLDALLAGIARGFNTITPFYQAGRYGFGPNTAQLLVQRNIKTDFSLLPRTDLRHAQGPDFRQVRSGAYHVTDTDLQCVTITRTLRGGLRALPLFSPMLDGNSLPARAIRSGLARSGLLERLTLTPEGMSTEDQIRLIQAEWLGGRRVFVLHFHSSSLAPGHTPYVRSEEARRGLLHSVSHVCQFFFETLGGLPGRPQDLLPVAQRMYGHPA